MNELMVMENIKIENMIYEIRGKFIMLDSEIYAFKYYFYLYDKIKIIYDIGKTISMFDNFIMRGEIIWN